ncbi:MAG TPA: PHP domain-containing protein [Candidatus Cryosericum sp.]|nr:PHP domain-containing protein [Candidatus Cryosericum sp.]
MTTIDGKQYAKFDLHIHTAETSKCGIISAPDLVNTYKENGYDGFVVTDHLHETYISLQNCRDDWQECVTRFLFGYQEAKRAGDEIGFTVALGAELRFPENDSDYLLYGIDEAFLREHPYLHRTDHASFFRKYGDQILIIHAHPFRDCDTVFYNSVHGLEVVNCNPRQKNRNELALQLAKDHPNLIRVCGSDAHRPGDEARAAVLFEDSPRDSFDVRRAILGGRMRLWCPDSAPIIQESETIVCASTR